MYCDESLKKYLDDLAAKLPAPGGGSAAALTAGLAAGLLSMVIHFTIGKPAYAKHEPALESLLEKTEKLRLEFLRLVDLDVIAYKSKNARDALNVPFMLARLCVEGIKLCPPLVQKGNHNLISDVGVAAVLFEGAFSSAVMNVQINLRMMNEPSFARKVNKELLSKGKSIRTIRKTVEVNVGNIIRR